VNPVIDEREGWTSASSAEADSLCAGRHLAQRGLPEEVKSADADTGTRIHAALQAGTPDGSDNSPTLTGDDCDTFEKCRDIEMEVTPKLFGDIDGNKLICKREHRLWLRAADLKHSGKADVIYIHRDTALVLDYTTGRNEATESPRNLQLRDLAVLVAANFGVKRVHVAIIQPWATMSPEVCTYEIDDLFNAQCELMARIAASSDPKAPRVPGDKQCQYCRAKATCAEFQAASLPVKVENATPETVRAGIMALEGERLGKFLSLVRLAEETATDEVRRRVESGDAVNGWILKPGRETEKITDAQMVFNRALATGITQQSFVADCITVGKTALKTALKTATGAKGKALDAKLDELLAGATETKTSNPILTKV
jgi:hypothetical protein